MSGGGGEDEFAVEEEHENHERYLVTYADMITLLMALFVILYAMGGPPEEEPYADFAHGAKEEIIHPLDGGIGVFGFGATEQPPSPIPFAEREEPTEVDASSATDLARELAGTGTELSSTVDERGVVLTMPDRALLFAPGSADLLDGGRQLIDDLAGVLAGTTNSLLVEGHTDSTPNQNESNWDLSSARASTVVEALIADGVEPTRLRVEGLADTHPVADNTTAEGRSKNRRVELVVQVDFASALPEPIAVGPDEEVATE